MTMKTEVVEWISVEDGLPQIYTFVLINTKFAGIQRAQRHEDSDDWNVGTWIAYIPAHLVTHWMPLPPPPDSN